MRMTVNKAIRLLRRRCGDTQQTFATAAGMSLRAYVKYEQEQMPEPRALVRFMSFAIATRNFDLSEVFEKALLRQLDVPPGWVIEIRLRKV
jgi:DNA-binding XRE family transcriptional regulator